MISFNEKEFLNIVHKYYPTRLESGTKEYYYSSEYIKLKKLIENAPEENQVIKKLKSFLHKYTLKNKSMSIQDYTFFFSEDRCYNIQMIIDNYESKIMHSICVNISLLIPYYTIYVLETKRTNDYKKRINSPQRKIELEKSNYNEILSSIKKYLDNEFNLIEFPSNLLFKVIPNISFQNANFNQFSFYNAFFLDDFYTR